MNNVFMDGFVSVTEVNKLVKSILDDNEELNNVFIKAEISNYKCYSSGHLYFTLKDENSEIRCVMFKGYASSLNFVPQDGMSVFVHGRISIYLASGQYQLYVDAMEANGYGNLFAEFEKLKEKLKHEGLFDDDHKLALPVNPQHIGIITSQNGAAVHDIINIISRRAPYIDLIIYPSLVQGECAPQSIINGINYFLNKKNVDIIIIGRGGGSIEDLWAFNDESLARVIYSSNIPIISAVGHETDYTISDFVADKRAPTPSAAAEIAVPDTCDYHQIFDRYNLRIKNILNAKINVLLKLLQVVCNSVYFKYPYRTTDDYKEMLDELNEKINKSFSGKISVLFSNVNNLSGRMDSLNPKSILKRGYSVVYSEYDKVINSIKNIEKDESLRIVVSDGSIDATVTEKKGEI